MLKFPETVQLLRRAKRQAGCFDRRVGLVERPRRVGWTDEGSPLFDCSRPLHLNIRHGGRSDLMLTATVFVRPEFAGPFDATVHLHSAGMTIAYRFCRPPGWKRYPISLRPLLDSAVKNASRTASVDVRFSGPQAGELLLGELKLENQPPRCLKTNVQGVSFPRSGHHMLVGVLESYFGPTFQYCGYYGMCECRPCAATTNHLQKNHDHEMDLRVNDDRDYLLQYRHPLEALVSQYEMRLARGGVEDSESIWRQFAVERLVEWKAWIRKWVLENKNPRAMKISYEEVLADPLPSLGRVVGFFDQRGVLDGERLEQVVRNHQLQRRRALRDFRYFDRELFRSLQTAAASELSALPTIKPLDFG